MKPSMFTYVLGERMCVCVCLRAIETSTRNMNENIYKYDNPFIVLTRQSENINDDR